jgi:hypothetical protein
MVTKAEFEHSMVDLRAELRTEFGELKAQTDLQFQQEAERAERRFAATEEQSRILVQAVISTIFQEIQMLESKIDKGNATSPMLDGTSSNPQPVSTYRTGPVPDKGPTVPEEMDYLKRDSKFYFPRADCPEFNGTNPVEWLGKCQSYFKLHQDPSQYRTHLATMQFFDEASEWYDSYLIDHGFPD